jgi:hypothetical protein
MAALTDGRMLHTTKLIMLTTVENNNSLVYCRSRVASNNASNFSALNILSIVALTMTVIGLAWTNRSKMKLKICLAPFVQRFAS